MCTTGEADPLPLLRAGLSGLADTDLIDLSDEQVRSTLPQLLRAVNQLAAVTAAMVGTFDTRGLAEVDGQRSTRTWLSGFGRMTQGAATGWLNRAWLLRQLPALAAAAAAGAASTEHLAKVKELADRIGIKAVTDFDEILADLAAAAHPAEVAKACERIAAHLDPDGKAPDPAEDFARRELTLSRQGGMTYLRGRLDPEAGAALHTALDALMKPPTADDLRTAPQRRADALADLARLSLADGRLPTVGGVRPQVGLLITPAMLLNHPTTPDTRHADTTTAPHTQPSDAPDTGCGPPATDPLAAAGVPPLPEPPWLGWVGEIPPDLAQRIACDCEVWRAILDPATGLPLEVGRTHRIVPHWIRKALHARDRGCRWPGCDVPAAWTDAHHMIAWYLGGRTDVDELLLLCRWHHSRVHEGAWRIELDHTTGEVRVYRPNGQPYELAPSQPWLSPNTKRGGPAPPHVGLPDGERGAFPQHGDP